jgi:hypothetical protein
MMSGEAVDNSSLGVTGVEGINERHGVGTVRDVNGPHGGNTLFIIIISMASANEIAV